MSTPPSSSPIASDHHAGPAWLDVGKGHRIWFEQTGAADGVTVLLLHGGPGSASSPRQRDPFDPARYRIVQFDQRGCGRSTPPGETAHNHTDALIGDIERLRQHLGIERWLVAGGSWGAALALAYAERHRERVSGLLLRGMFLAEPADLDWFFHGVAAFAPQAHAAFMAAIPRRWRRSVVTYLDRTFSGAQRDEAKALRVATAWQAYESRLDSPSTASALPAPPGGTLADRGEVERLLARYRVQAHYLARRCFLRDSAVMRCAGALHGVPMALVHGTHDWVCRPANAWRVHRACAGSRLAWADGAGHHPWHPATAGLLREAADGFAVSGDFSAWPRASAPEAA